MCPKHAPRGKARRPLTEKNDMRGEKRPSGCREPKFLPKNFEGKGAARPLAALRLTLGRYSSQDEWDQDLRKAPLTAIAAKMTAAAVTIDGPAGVSCHSDNCNPARQAAAPMTVASKAIDSGVRVSARAAAAEA